MKQAAKLFLLLICGISLMGNMVFAASIPAVVNPYTGTDSVTLYLKETNADIQEVYIGNELCTDYTAEEAGEKSTVVIVDNSLSIPSRYWTEIKTFLADLAASKNDGDVFTIATFSQNITYLTENDDDYLSIKEKIDGLSFEDQDTYFTKTLYDVLDKARSEDGRYTRIIIIADGAEYEKVGYTDGELEEKILAEQIPIYAIGCVSEHNEENLKKMFSLARLSNGKSYMMGENPFSDILQDIHRDEAISKVVIRPPLSACDGTRKTVRVSFGDDYCTSELNMPFIAEQPDVPAPAPAPVPEETKPAVSPVWILTGCGALAAVIVVIAVLVLRNRKKAAGPSEQPGLQTDEAASDRTELLQPDRDVHGSDTELISSNKSMRLRLQDIKDPVKTFEYPVRDSLLIGKDRERCQIVIDYNRYVSGVHCEVYRDGNDLIVRDGGDNQIRSRNGTYVNGRKAAPDLPLPSGAVLKLGELEFRVSY